MTNFVLINSDLDLALVNFMKYNYTLYSKFARYKKTKTRREALWQNFATEQGLSVKACKKAWKSLRDKFSDKMRKKFWSDDTIQNDSILSFLFKLHSVQKSLKRPPWPEILPAENINNRDKKNTTHVNTNIVPNFVIQDLIKKKVDTIFKQEEAQQSNIVTQDVIEQLLEARNDKEVVEIDPQNLKNKIIFNPINSDLNSRDATDSRRLDLTKNSSSNNSTSETVVTIYTHNKYPERVQKNRKAIDKNGPPTKKLRTDVKNNFKDDTSEINVAKKEPNSMLKRLLNRKLEAKEETTRLNFSSNIQSYVNNIVSEINDLENTQENLPHQYIEFNEEKRPSEKVTGFASSVDVEDYLSNVRPVMKDDNVLDKPEKCQNWNLEIDKVDDSLHVNDDLNDIMSKIYDQSNSSNTITMYGEGTSTVIQLPGMNNPLRLTRRRSEESALKPRSLIRHYNLTTKEFFSEMGKYINKQFTSQKQKELCTQIRSMVNTLLLEERAAGS